MSLRGQTMPRDPLSDAVSEYAHAVREAAYSDCSPMGDPGNRHKHDEADQSRQTLDGLIAALQQRAEAAERELAELREEVAAARKLWDHLKELCEPWGEYQDAYVEFGLLERVEIPDDAPVEERCEDCDGECGWCYRDSGLIGPLPGGEGS